MMDLRERIRANSRGTAIFAVVMFVIACMLIIKSRGAGRSLPTFQTKSFYTCDDGSTLFADDINKIPPFDHDGQQAVAARVMTSEGGQHRWVQYLAKYNDETLEKLKVPQQDPGKNALGPSGLLVKKPGAGQWVPMMSPKGMQIIQIQVPDGVPAQTVREAQP